MSLNENVTVVKTGMNRWTVSYKGSPRFTLTNPTPGRPELEFANKSLYSHFAADVAYAMDELYARGSLDHLCGPQEVTIPIDLFTRTLAQIGLFRAHEPPGKDTDQIHKYLCDIKKGLK